MSKLDRGLILVNTGDGKGKTTAALGTVLRAVGQGLKPVIIQFIKGNWRTGEQEAVILTGRGAPPELVAAADLVTEMHLVKHHYEQGVDAVRGIEF